VSWTPPKTGNSRVDKVFSYLAGKIRDIDRRAGVIQTQADETEADVEDVKTRAGLIDDVFLKTFDSGVSGWNVRAGDGTTSLPSNGSVGGNVLRVEGGELWVAYPDNMVYHPDRLYRMRVRARLVTAPTTGGAKFYAGVEGVASDGTTLVNGSGDDSYSSQHYVGVGGDDLSSYPLGEWQEYLTYFQGRESPISTSLSGDPRNPAHLHDSVRYMRPMFILNYDDGDGVMEIDAIGIEVVTESAEIGALETMDPPAEAGADATAGKSLWTLSDRDPEAVSAEPGVHVGSNAPSSTNKLWLDTTGGEPYTWRRHDGSVWVRATREDADVNALDTQNAPAEGGADATAGKSLSVLEDRYLANLLRSATNNSTLAEILAKMDDVGDLLQGALYDDGVGKRKFVVGRQGNEHADGDVILFEEPFQNTPTIVFAPGGRTTLPSSGGAPDAVFANIFGMVVQPSGGATTKVYDYVRPDDLSASGFTLVAKLIERDITVVAESDSFPLDTLTAQGEALALGGLTEDAGDDQYKTLYDYVISVDSTSDTSTKSQSFPAGTLTALNESIGEDLDDVAANDLYDVSWGGSLEATADGSTVSDSMPSGSLTSVDDTSEVSLSDEAMDNSYTVYYEVTAAPGESISLALESSTDSGTSWTTHKTPSYDGDAMPSSPLSTSEGFTADLAAGDLVRIRVTAVDGGSVSADRVEYSAADDYSVDVTVSVIADGTNRGSEMFTAADSDGSGTTQSLTHTEQITDSGLAVGHTIEVKITNISETGSGTYDLSCDPDKVVYEAGDVDTATLEIEVAIDSKDGSGAWVERVVNTHQVTDDTGSGTSKNKSGSGVFTSSAIEAGDDVRVRLKTVTVTGSADSSSQEVTPDSVDYSSYDGDETAYSKTPVTGDTIRWDAVAG
jgi:hypothetical protein